MKIEMKRLHIEKKAIRALGIAESFVKTQNQSVLVGIVMRSDIVIDGVSYASATIKGDDATDTIINIYENLDRTDINFVIFSKEFHDEPLLFLSSIFTFPEFTQKIFWQVIR